MECVRKFIIGMTVKLPDNVYGRSRSKFLTPAIDIWDCVTRRHYRSTYEVYVARFFTEEGISFIYEFITLKVGRSNYTPDFWLPDINLFVEVKGAWGMSAKKKFESVLHSDYDIILLSWNLYHDFRSRYSEMDMFSNIK